MDESMRAAAPPHPATVLVMPPAAARTMHAPHARVPLPPGTRTETVWIWLLVVMPWVFASTIFLFDLAAVLDALWVGDEAGALADVALHAGLLVTSSLTTTGCALLFASRDARHLRTVGVIRPFPWGFAAIAGIVYLIGRTVVLRTVTRPPFAPTVAAVVLYAVFYAGFIAWAITTLTNALHSLSSVI